MRSLIAALTVAVLSVGAGAQQTRDQARIILAGTATVSGSVVLDDEKRPALRRATVTLMRQGLEDMRTTATDDLGRYSFTDLPAGTYTLAAAKGGHIGIWHGAPKPGMPGQAIFLREGQAVALPPVAVPRGAVIAGRVVDRFGQPVPNLGVQAALFLTINGERRRRAITGGTGTAVTNQHGDYRMFGLQPGSYVVFATPPSGPRTEMIDTTPEAVTQAQRPDGKPVPLPVPLMYVPTLFPGVSDSAVAATIDLGKGQERTGIDFALQHVAVGQVRGTVTGPDGGPPAGLRLTRQNVNASGLLPSESSTVVTDRAGRFTMANVPPGTYLITAVGVPSPPQAVELGLLPAGVPPATAYLFGSATATVSSGASLELSIRMEPAPTLTGTVAVTGGAKSEGVGLRLTPAGGGTPARQVVGTINAERTFRLEGVVPGSYRLAVNVGPRGSFVLSAMLGDVDVLDVPFEVTAGVTPRPIVINITDAPPTISGRLVDAAGAPVSSLYVMAFSANAAHWFAGSRRIGAMRAGVDGSYLFDTLPPGEYYLCALTELDPTLQNEPAFLQELMAASVRLTLKEGQAVRQDLRVR